MNIDQVSGGLRVQDDIYGFLWHFSYKERIPETENLIWKLETDDIDTLVLSLEHTETRIKKSVTAGIYSRR